MGKERRDLKKIILILVLVSLLLGGTIYVIYRNDYSSEEIVDIFEESEKEIEKNEEISESENNKKVTVDIKGNVINPGVYEVDNISRVNDVIILAGGLTENADTSNINLAKIVSDEMTIIIYSKEEVIEKFKQEVCICNCPYIENNACIDEESESDSLININTASLEELTTLPGVGDVKAETIIKYRTDNGKFNEINDLLKVDGIGEALFEKIKPYIKV